MNNSKSSLFLMELILAILVFSIAGAVCIQIFVKAHLLSEDSYELNRSVKLCENAAECFYSQSGDLTRMEDLLDGDLNYSCPLSDSFLCMYYNDNFTLCSEAESTFALEISTNRYQNLVTGDIRMRDRLNDNVVYVLNCKKALGEEVQE